MYELAVTDIKNVYWSANYAYAAVLTKSQILIVNKNLEILKDVLMRTMPLSIRPPPILSIYSVKAKQLAHSKVLRNLST
jgi:hypothetical protein